MKHRKYFEPLNEEDKELQEEHKYGNDEQFEVVLLIVLVFILAMVVYRFFEGF